MLQRDDFKGMRHNPFAVPPGKKMVEYYSALGRSRAFTEIPSLNGSGKPGPASHILVAQDLEDMVRFVVLMVEPRGNPLSRERNFDIRAEEAWRLVGTRQNSELRKLQKMGHWWFHNTLFEYFKFTWDTVYQEWFSQKMAYQEMSRVLAMPMLQTEADKDDVKTRLDISNALEKFRTRISALESTLFGDSETLEIVTVNSYFPDRLAEKYAMTYPDS